MRLYTFADTLTMSMVLVRKTFRSIRRQEQFAAQSGRKIIAINVYPLACSKACLQNHDIQHWIHVELTLLGVKKKNHEDFDLEEAKNIQNVLEQFIAQKKERTNETYHP